MVKLVGLRPVVRFTTALLILGVVGISWGQDAPLLSFNSPEVGEVSSDEGVRWAFSASANGVYSIYVEALDSDLDPVVRIEDNRDRLIIENDDYDYPNDRSARVEAFTVATAGTYYVSITGFGGTQGRYRVTLYNGYSDFAMYENFNGALTWQAFSVPEDEDNAVFIQRDGSLNLAVTGIQQELALRSGSELEADFYASVQVRDVVGQNGWQVGMITRLQGDSDFIAYLIDQRGYWRLVERREGSDRIIRDWSAHPAIIAEERSFSLGVLAYGEMLELFYNDTYVGTVTTQLQAGGDIGIVARTVNALGSQTDVTFDNFIVTVPALKDAPHSILRASGNAAIRNLQRQHLIAPTGALFLNLDSISIQDGTAGIRRFPLASGSSFSDFALGIEIDWQIDRTVLAGCGLVIHDALERHAYGLVFVDNQGGYSLSERSGDDFLEEIFQIDANLTTPPYRLVLIFRDSRLLVYINEIYRGSILMRRAQGSIGTAIVNYEPSLTSCSYRNLWIWKPEI